MADDLTPDRQASSTAPAVPAAPHLPAVTSPGRDPRRRAVFRVRFAVAYLALAVFAGVGIGLGVLLVQDPPQPKENIWSAWIPTGRESSYPNQIADYVSGRYRLPSGRALVGVIASEPQVQGVDVIAVAIQNDPEGASDDISIVRTDDSMMYVLCGLGDQCSINEGEPSEDRHLLLRREALELALYTFNYVGGVDSVIALLPPRPPQNDEEQTQSTALFFQKKDFGPELDRPLSSTLLRTALPQVAEVDPVEGLVVNRLTTPYLFQYEFRQAQEGSAIMVLAPLVAAQ